MTPSQQLQQVRAFLETWVASQAAEHPDSETTPSPTPVPMRESVLIRNGFYLGRRFASERFRAIWFIEEAELKIDDSNGQRLARFDFAAIQNELRPHTITFPGTQGTQGTEVRRAA